MIHRRGDLWGPRRRPTCRRRSTAPQVVPPPPTSRGQPPVNPSALPHRNFPASLASQTARRAARALVYAWAFPTTLVGLLFLPPVLLSRTGRARVVGGVLEIHGGPVDWFLRHCTLLRGGASAMTLGHVVLGRDERLLDLTRAHERVHVR